MQANRLFDYLIQQKDKNGNLPFLSYKNTVTNKWESYTYTETYNNVLKTAQLLIQYGLKPNDKVALIAENAPEWNFVDLAIQMLGGVCVPMYPTISQSDYLYIFNDAEIKIAFVSTENIYKKVASVIQEIPTLSNIISFAKIENVKQFSQEIDEIVFEEEKIISASNKVDTYDLATIIYTSGTTGNPKGVMLTHNNIISNLNSIQQDLPLLEGKKALSFLPLCHSFERTVFYAYLAYGIHIYYAESLEKIADNLKEVQPYCFTTVPRLLEKVFDKILDKVQALSFFKKLLFNWAMEVGMAYEYGKEKKDLLYSVQLNIARTLVFSKWKDALGGKIEFIVTGAAPIQPRLIRLFTAAGIDVLEGYGLTETSPVLAINRMGMDDRKIGTVGMPVRGVEVKIADDGEIIVKGPNIMKGYYHQPELTADVIDKDGWFHTGDIGEMVDGKFMKITDRKKELFKTSGGKYIAPQSIENKMKESKYIEQIMIVGEYQKYIAALIIPNFIYLNEFAKNNSISFSSNQELLQNDAVLKLYQKEIDTLNTSFGRWEQIKKFSLLPDEWTALSGELTPTLKLKRKIILAKYQTEIEKMFV